MRSKIKQASLDSFMKRLDEFTWTGLIRNTPKYDFKVKRHFKYLCKFDQRKCREQRIFPLLVNASVERLDGAFKDQSDEGGFRVARQNSRRQRQLERVAPSKDRCTYIISSSLDLLV